jgi:hypothetical protein
VLKNSMFLAAAVALALDVGACAHHDKERVSKDDVRREQAEARATADAYVDQKVDDVHHATNEKISLIDSKIASLRQASKGESATVKAKIEESIVRLESKKDRVKNRAKEIEAMGKTEQADAKDEWVRLGHELDDVTAALDDVQHDIKTTK